jgi:hypothetical protein
MQEKRAFVTVAPTLRRVIGRLVAFDNRQRDRKPALDLSISPQCQSTPSNTLGQAVGEDTI